MTFEPQYKLFIDAPELAKPETWEATTKCGHGPQKSVGKFESLAHAYYDHGHTLDAVK